MYLSGFSHCGFLSSDILKKCKHVPSVFCMILLNANKIIINLLKCLEICSFTLLRVVGVADEGTARRLLAWLSLTQRLETGKKLLVLDKWEENLPTSTTKAHLLACFNLFVSLVTSLGSNFSGQKNMWIAVLADMCVTKYIAMKLALVHVTGQQKQQDETPSHGLRNFSLAQQKVLTTM